MLVAPVDEITGEEHEAGLGMSRRRAAESRRPQPLEAALGVAQIEELNMVRPAGPVRIGCQGDQPPEEPSPRL